MKKKKTLVLGLGNEILTDDGIGPKLVKDISLTTDDPDIHFNIACCGGLEIMEHIRDFDRVIIIDAIRTRNGNPGDVYRFRPDDFRETSHLSSIHDISFLTAIRLGETLDMKLPEEMHILAVEIIEDLEIGDDFTPPVKKKYPKILEEVRSCIKEFSGN